MKKSLLCWLGGSLVLVWRIYLSFKAPTETSDLYRSLGFSSHLRDWGFEIYKTTAADFAPEFWTSFWTYQGYIYPPGAITFFGFFSVLGVGLGWVKLTLTLLDLASANILRQRMGWLPALLFFASPLNLWFTSHEGQFESLVVFLLIFSASLLMQQRWFWSALLLTLAIQVKQFAVLLAPFFLYQYLSLEKSGRKAMLVRGMKGIALGTAPFIGFYISSPNLFFLPFANLSLQFNPFYWNPLSETHGGWASGSLIMWNSFASYLLFVVTLVFCLLSRPRTLASLQSRVLLSAPLGAFTLLIKVLNWGHFWYGIVVSAYIFPLWKNKHLVIVLFIIYFFLDGRSLLLSLGQPLWGVAETKETVRHFTSCLLTCDYRRAGGD